MTSFVRSSDFVKRSRVTSRYALLLEVTDVQRSSGFVKRSEVTSRYAALLEVTPFNYFWFVDDDYRQVEWFHEAQRNEFVSRPSPKSSWYASFHFATQSDLPRQVEWFHGVQRNEIVSRPSLKLLDTLHFIPLLEVTGFVRSSGFMEQGGRKLYRDHH